MEQEKKDVERTRYFEFLVNKAIRFWNDQVMNDIAGIISAIEIALGNERFNQKARFLFSV